jgi:uncharacterized membrane protein YeaQ/YmgE (transglycosylase-associated protein family)
MQVLPLFILGGLLGLIASSLTGARSHLPRFNNVAIAIIGALVGGTLLPRLASTGGPAGSVSTTSILLALAVAVSFLAILIGLRRKFDGHV